MKKASDPRHIARIKIMQELFSHDFKPGRTSKGAREVIVALPQIDQVVAKSAPEWPVAKINKVDLAILRLAIFELIIKKGEPFKVVVDEAVELAKEFGSDASPAFINGVLGNVINGKPN
ncbi:transcription antitermination factor NusB [Candidatus Daviesbacteria bacterium RIFOXYD1_FULL_41_10]|uniref:Transcription antitermination factor NusB n=2 Tax=Candidatus Daviesiibacteriota TaxID=1752718 RepID=A0A1F5N324_9BACT|nr:MAG: N utilization substance protein B-like protein [Candidatus Daviesbacteria bacterium GW2011_GWB1_41_5]OGE71870.1 MAG: transcription antitermination factor NusB [Candidatus Daviesbacteria bacterium RIFOXYD1_FULL_41_10]